MTPRLTGWRTRTRLAQAARSGHASHIIHRKGRKACKDGPLARYPSTVRTPCERVKRAASPDRRQTQAGDARTEPGPITQAGVQRCEAGLLAVRFCRSVTSGSRPQQIYTVCGQRCGSESTRKSGPSVRGAGQSMVGRIITGRSQRGQCIEAQVTRGVSACPAAEGMVDNYGRGVQ